MLKHYQLFSDDLSSLPTGKVLISTINAHSYNVSRHDPAFREALQKSDVLIPDGVSITLASRILHGKPLKKIAGADLFAHQMARLDRTGGKVMFLGSCGPTLSKIVYRAQLEYPNVQIHVFSPPYKPEFSEEDNRAMLAAVNAFVPDVLFLGMTAPKQEKWAYRHFEQLQAGHICCVGAVFDFYAGSVKRAPQWMIRLGLEWLYRLVREPRRLWKRYLIGNAKFLWSVTTQALRPVESAKGEVGARA